MRSRAKTIGIMLGLAAIYFCAGKFGLSLAFVNRSASAVWPPAGIALAALLLFGVRLWPGVFLGAFLVNITTQGSWATSFGIALGNTLEACIAAALIDRFARGRKAFERTQDIFRFFAFATLLGAGVSASIGVTTLCLGGFASWSQFGVIWFTWWLGDGVSILVITPLLVILFRGGRRPLRERRVLEGLSSVVVLLATVFFIFWGADSLLHRRAPLEYLAIPPLLWMAFRFGPAGATLSTCITSAIAVWATLHGFGPFAAPDSNQALVLLQGFMGTITFTMLVLASVIVERQRSEHRLKAQDNISRVLAEARTLAETRKRVLQHLCEMGGWEAGGIWRIDRDADQMSCIEIWHASHFQIPEFEAASRQLKLKTGAGLPGRVWMTGEPVWVRDVTEDENFPRAEAARRDGLHSAVCFPIRLGGATLGAIECFSREVREPDQPFIQMMADIGRQFGQFIERKQAEEALRASEEMHRTVAETAADGIITIDEASVIRSINPAVERIFGYSRSELLRQSLTMLMPESLRGMHRAAIERYLRTGRRTISWEGIALPGLHKNGQQLSLEIAFGVSVKEGGHVFTGVIRDITERKRAEEALRESEERFRAVADNIPQLAWMTDEMGAVTWYNKRWFDFTGTNFEQMKGGGRQHVHHPDYIQAVTEKFKSHLHSGGAWEDIFPLRGKDGEYRWFLSRAFPIRDHQGKITRWFGSNTDITELREVQEALQQARRDLEDHAASLENVVAERTAKLRETIAELEAFSYSLSHDMRAPLRAIQGFSQLVLEEHADKLDAEAVSYLRKTKAAAHRMDRLIQDVLSFTRISRQDIQLQPVNLDKLVRDIIDERPELQGPAAEIAIASPLLAVVGHEASLTQCLTNMLDNAVKFVAPGVKPRVRVWTEPREDKVRLWIEDNGIGIEAESQNRLFSMFERLHSQTAYEGTGIGLAIVRKAIERMKGDVGLESEPGRGSRFWFELPRAS